jgi:MFS family permease
MVTMMILAVVFGSAQALVFPATSALVSNHVDPDHLGAGLGLTGALNNSAKVAGPILGGFLVAQFDFAQTLQLLGLMLLLGGGVVLLSIRLQQRRLPKGFVTIERAMVAVESMERPNNQ